MRHFLLSATHRSSGKTTLAIGISAALHRLGHRVQTFKKGPDYIDPLWLAAASARPCYNLDFHTMRGEEIDALFESRSSGADVALVEGNMGLYDGMALDGHDSNAALAERLGSPVILVVDTRGTTRGIAPLLLGYQAFAQHISIAGVILNRVGGARHEGKLRRVVEHYTDLPLLGAVGTDPRLTIDERHLGLTPGTELQGEGHHTIGELADAVAQQIDLEALLRLAARRERVDPIERSSPTPRSAPRIGYLRDRAFCFYYADDLESLVRLGAQLIPIDALNERALPPLDGLLIGGGFPETAMQGLEANRTLRTSIRTFIEEGGPTYAECGGLMYLARAIIWRGARHEMVGVIQGDVVMHDRPQGRGYLSLTESGEAPWGRIVPPGEEIAAHEFHHSALTDLQQEYRFAYRVNRGTGIDGFRDGLIYKNLLASYAHLRATGGNRWTERFLQLVEHRIQASATPPP